MSIPAKTHSPVVDRIAKDTLFIEGVNKVYETQSGTTHALENINLTIREGEFVSIIGPSGCGKSTLLKILANLEKPSSGEIKWEEKSSRDQIGFVFQDSTLLPWKNVLDNSLFPLKVKKMDTRENLERVEYLLKMAGLDSFKKAYPNELSGGMKQRVSIVRSLSFDPKVLLMDEPFGALDAMTRDKMNIELQRIWNETKKTVLFITHSINEAVFLSDRVVVMSPRPGRIDKVFTIDLKRPRTVDVRETLEFVKYVKEIREVLGNDD
ncbi:ABC transporter ATP-binding protein [Metabacillus schmidteae]|uniref:ABC transporter ATP-binding protein n=1 Tax=Metabacillus schmidteae TaxID=2730405 RepID=UPI00158F0AC0|nr:ABC transporter ATP-binding protein [Metabacillus schmidteae]